MTDRPASLNSYAEDVHSQFGEDGILRRLFELLNIERGTCCEFGAWDGNYLSNTFRLIDEAAWGGLLIEADPVRHQDLVRNMGRYEGVTCMNRFVSFDGPNRLDALLAEAGMAIDFDLLSIDIDGADYHVWNSLQEFRPKVVVIEHNPSIPNSVDFVQPADMTVSQGSSLAAMVRLGTAKGYRLVAATVTNGIFVREALFQSLGLDDGATIDDIRTNDEHQTKLFQLYDGTIIVAGCDRLLWQGVQLRPERMQVFPAWLRGAQPKWKRAVRRVAQAWYKVRPF